jgi:hypothetical protein
VSTCGTCGWDWDKDDAENRTTLDERLLKIIGDDMAAHPDAYTPEAILERWPTGHIEPMRDAMRDVEP